MAKTIAVKITLPQGIIQKIDKLIKTKNPDYTSRADFCKTATTEQLKKHQQEQEVAG